jgi:hypothetical protein
MSSELHQAIGSFYAAEYLAFSRRAGRQHLQAAAERRRERKAERQARRAARRARESYTTAA